MPISDYTPTVAQVASLLRARTKDRFNNEVGTFLPDPGPDADPSANRTRPTAEQASQLILEAVEELSLNIGVDLPDAPGDDKDAIRKSAMRVASLLGGMNIEMSLFPDSVGRGGGTEANLYAALERRYNKAFPLLLSAIEAAGGQVSGEEVGSGSGTGNTSYGYPSYDFGDHEVTSFEERF